MVMIVFRGSTFSSNGWSFRQTVPRLVIVSAMLRYWPTTITSKQALSYSHWWVDVQTRLKCELKCDLT